MRLVMGGESLQGPLTGIGQYTYHMAKEMLARPEIEDFNFLAHGRLREPESLMGGCGNGASDETSDSGKPSKINQFLGRARSITAQSKLAVALYERLMLRLERHSLRHYCPRDVYHSPNYMLPHFPGRRVVSILDLSTYRFPEQHPEARVRFVNSHIKKTLRHADHIITISNIVKEEIIERFNYPEDQITVTYLGADDAFRPHSKEEFQSLGQSLKIDYKGYFLFVSSIEPRKNLERLLDAYLAYRTDCSDQPLPLIVAGTPGWKSQHIHNRLKEIQAKGDVRYFGYVDQDMLPALVAGARALLYPSLYEGFGLPVLEAMKSGTAVMTSKSTAMAEVGGKAVMQIDPYRVDAMTEAMAKFEQDAAAVNAMEQSGLEAAQKYSWQRCAELTFAVYQPKIG